MIVKNLCTHIPNAFKYKKNMVLANESKSLELAQYCFGIFGTEFEL